MSWLTTFDPDSDWFEYTGIGVFIFSTAVFLVGNACLISVKTLTNRTFKILLGGNFCINYLCQMSLSIGTQPVILFPMCGGYPAGLMKYTKVPTLFQTAAVVYMICCISVFVSSLPFIYRNHILTPFSPTATHLFLFLYVFVIVIAPVPSLYSCLGRLNTTSLKHEMLQKFPLECATIRNFWDEALVIIPLSEDKYCILAYILLVGNLCAFVVITSCLSWRMSSRLMPRILSATTLQMHKNLIRSLTAQVLTQSSLTVIPCIGILTCCFWELNFPGIAPVFLLTISLSDSIGVLVFLILYREYRTSLVNIITKGIFKCTKRR